MRQTAAIQYQRAAQARTPQIARADVCVVIPAFNERLSLATVLEALAPLPYRVIVVDDGSTDDTAAVAHRFNVCVIRHAWNLGQGAALQTGIDYALRLPMTRYVVTFDADGQHRADDIPRVLAPLELGSHDVVLGSRFATGAAAIDVPPLRRLMLRAAVAFTRLTTRLRLTDTHNGVRAFTRAAASGLNITQNRMAHASQILSRVAELGLRYREVPVTVQYTPYSVAKGQTLLDALTIVWDIATARIR
ncbi:MAG TPA: glycosyltransferase family 2 protein [Gemmatimonadaceae bacterium]|nr:glycosyltransferase family 2 protein [Gemmatimonadaceae bacterium]